MKPDGNVRRLRQVSKSQIIALVLRSEEEEKNNYKTNKKEEEEEEKQMECKIVFDRMSSLQRHTRQNTFSTL